MRATEGGSRDAPHGGEGQCCGDTTLRLSGCRQKGKESPEAAIQHLTCEYPEDRFKHLGDLSSNSPINPRNVNLWGGEKIQDNKKVSAGKQSSPAPKSIYETMKHEGRG